MIKNWLTWLNYLAAGVILLLLLAAFYFWWAQQTHFPLQDFTMRKSAMPTGGFVRSKEEYDAIAAPALQLSFFPLNTQLPDLRRVLIYYGRNGRPDAKPENPMLFFGFTGNKVPISVFPGERLYVAYDKGQNPPQYVFSPNNAETPLWIEATASGNTAHVKVGLKTDQNEVIRDPSSYADFTLNEKEFVRFGGVVWEIGKWRVDGTLLARQKARWFGLDKFLDKHGGKEYEAFQNKQRIDFGEPGSIYSVYVNTGDCLIWNANQEKWQPVFPGIESIQHPLMCVKKIDDRILNLELWDVDGKGKVVLNLIKNNEAWQPQSLEQQFKFIGARTRSQFVFEINHERMFLSPFDWLLFIDGEWRKLTTPEEVDEYVERKLVGPLFIFDQIERKEDRQVIIGTLFNAARTEAVTIELPLQQNSPSSAPNGQKRSQDEKIKKSKETNISPMIKRDDVKQKQHEEEVSHDED
jgi:hypothetical protein